MKRNVKQIFLCYIREIIQTSESTQKGWMPLGFQMIQNLPLHISTFRVSENVNFIHFCFEGITQNSYCHPTVPLYNGDVLHRETEIAKRGRN